MIPPSLLKLSSIALALATPALSCVQFSLNINEAAGFVVNAALTDNGGQVCALVNAPLYASLSGANPLSCIGGYAASWSSLTGVVSYSYPGFSGSFGTSSYYVGETEYFVANVWGC
ncbi:unnamed protein product [Discula destructiva]